MGLKEEVDIVHYALPIRISFKFDGQDILDPTVNVHLTNAAGQQRETLSIALPLTAAQRNSLKTALGNKLTAFENATGWTAVDA